MALSGRFEKASDEWNQLTASSTGSKSGRGSQAPRSARLVGVWSSVYYVAVSVSLTVFNKVIFAQYNMQQPLVLFVAQSLATMLCLSVLFMTQPQRRRVESTYTSNDTRAIRSTQSVLQLVRRLMPLSLASLLMVWCGLEAMRFTTLLMYNTLRKTSLFFVLSCEYLFLYKVPSLPTVLSISVIVLGAGYAGFRDLYFDLAGYVLAFTSNLATSLYLVLIKRIRDQLGLDNLTLLFWNTALTSPVIVLLATLRGDFPRFASYAFHQPGSFWIIFAVDSFLGLVINHSIYCNTTANSPLTQAVSAQFKDVVLFFVSYFAFDRAMTSNGTIVGVIITFLGALWYASIKFHAAPR